MRAASAATRTRGGSARYARALLWWGIPALIGGCANFLALSSAGTGWVWAVAFAWMGTGCVLNARRCGRRHCFFSGPVLWGGAVGAALIGLRVLSGAHVLDDVVWGTTVLVALSFLPEALWGPYVRRS